MKTSLSFHLFIIVLASQQRTSAAQTVCGSHGEVRLVNGYLPSEGHAEVCLDGVWVGACGIGWDNVDAAVVCRQLGYSSAGATGSASTLFGTGNASEYIVNVDCTGIESGLANCTYVVQPDCSGNVGITRCKYNGVPGMYYNGQPFQNNSVINAENIGNRSTSVISNTVVCLTNRLPCCNSADGNWYDPTGVQLPTTISSSFDQLHLTRQVVVLYRAASAPRSSEGLFRCQIYDRGDMVQNMYIGIYSSGTGAPIVSSLNYERSSQTLICTSTGGPAASVTWSKDNVTLSVDGTTFQHSPQVITNISTATYENRLRILHENQESYGVYACTVSNLMGTDSSQELAVGACDDGDAVIASNGAVIRLCYNMVWHNVAVTPTQTTSAGATEEITTGLDMILIIVLGSLLGVSLVILFIVCLACFVVSRKRKHDNRSNDISLKERTNSYHPTTFEDAQEHMVGNSMYGLSTEAPATPLSPNVAYVDHAQMKEGAGGDHYSESLTYECIDNQVRVDGVCKSNEATAEPLGQNSANPKSKPRVGLKPPSLLPKDDHQNPEYGNVGRRT